MGTWNARLVSVALLAVLLGTPAAGVACAFDCAVPMAASAASRVSGHASAGCHEAPPAPEATRLDRGDRDNCRDHVLPGEGAAAVLASAPAGLQQPAALVVAAVPASVTAPAAVLVAARPIRGPSTPSTAIARPPLVLRI